MQVHRVCVHYIAFNVIYFNQVILGYCIFSSFIEAELSKKMRSLSCIIIELMRKIYRYLYSDIHGGFICYSSLYIFINFIIYNHLFIIFL